MDTNRELEIRFHIATVDGDLDEVMRCLDAGVDIECLVTVAEMDDYRENNNNSNSQRSIIDFGYD